jgi:type II secretion system protein N
VEIGVSAEDGQVVEPIVNSDSQKKNKDKKQPKERRLVYTVDEVSVNLGMLALAFGELDVEVDVEALGGTLKVDFEGPLSFLGGKEIKNDPSRNTRAGGEDRDDGDIEEDTPISLEVEIEGILLEQIHDLKSILPVPIMGTLDFELEIDSPTSKLADSSGHIAVALRSLILSRKNFESEIFGMNLAVPPLVITALNSEVVFEKGEGKITGFDMESKHIAGNVQGGVALKDPLPESQLDMYLTFKPLPAYIAKSNILKTLMPDIDSLSRDAKKAHRADGSFGFRYGGKLGKSGKFVAAKNYTPRGSRKARASRAKRSRSRARPSRRTRTKRPKKIPTFDRTTPASTQAKSVDAKPKPVSEPDPPIREPQGSASPPVLRAKRGAKDGLKRDKEPPPREEEEIEEPVEEEEVAEEESEEEAEVVEESEQAEEADEADEAEVVEKEEDTEEE